MNAPVLDHPQTLAERLKQETTTLHERLDTSIVGKSPFADTARYGAFVETQYRFYAVIEPLYHDETLGALIPGLASRSRLEAARLDLIDLGRAVPEVAPVEIPDDARLGWLYVSEGSTLGAAFLLKAVGALGFNEEKGARHLAASPEGRGKHWREFKDAINTVTLTPEQDAAAIAGANAAFAHVQQLVGEVMVPA